jgi:toxin ParE1/3/4
MKVVWTITARKSLVVIHNFIAIENPHAAKRVVRQLRQVTDKLADFPNFGRLGIEQGTREVIVPNLAYIVVYRVANSQVQVLGLIHTSQDRIANEIDENLGKIEAKYGVFPSSVDYIRRIREGREDEDDHED